MDKPYSSSCDENSDPILRILQPRLQDRQTLLEIGSGTGQHAVYFSQALPHIQWQTSDVKVNHSGIEAWMRAAGQSNILPPLALDVLHDAWPDARYDAIFSANTAHIMGEKAVQAMFAGAGPHLNPDGIFVLYGPFNRDGRYTSTSNERFDQWLQQRDPDSGIKDIGWLQNIAAEANLELYEEISMPANNLILVWQHRASS